MKVTPAMKKWCRALRDGGAIKRDHVTSVYARTRLGGGGLTYVMASRLEDFGLIRWEPPTKVEVAPGFSRVVWQCPTVTNPQRAVLTDAGREAAK